MELAEFRRAAGQAWEEIPDEYREGVDGLVIEREPRPHPTLADIYTLGECLTESYPSDWSGPETTRSVLVLYYGSFRELAALDPDFDWGYEIWETVTHELHHHLEWLALEDSLEGVDYAMDENFKRFQGEPFDPFFYRSGKVVAPGVFEAERDVFIEREYAGAPDRRITFQWRGRAHEIVVPDDPGDVAFLQVVEGVDTGPLELCVVLVRRKRWIERLRDLFRSTAPAVLDTDVTARALD